MRSPHLRLLAALLMAVVPAELDAQRQHTAPADPSHAAGALHRTLFGDGYRDVWTVPITVPVVPMPATKWVMRSPSSRRISTPVPR